MIESTTEEVKFKLFFGKFLGRSCPSGISFYQMRYEGWGGGEMLVNRRFFKCYPFTLT